jgi:2,3-bisphosphoglycerate-independent phosphoglycerate mutase
MLTAMRLNGGVALAHAVKQLYGEGQSDYRLEPIVVVDAHGMPIGRVEDGDAVIFCCRRGEREVQLTEAFTEPGFTHFQRPAWRDLDFVILTLYHDKFRELPVAFAPAKVEDTLAQVVSRAHLRQMHVAESEKYAHVTFFLNGGHNQPFEGEEDVRIPSPQGIPFDQVPELSLAQVAEQVLAGIEKRYDLIVTNFANGDVIGHTQNGDAKIKCAELVDERLGQVVNAALGADYVVLVTADHGNLEEMTNADGTPNVSHTSNPVPFLLLDSRRGVKAESVGNISRPNPLPPSLERKGGLLSPFLSREGGRGLGQSGGRLADVAPTVLQALGIQQPSIMTGTSLAGDYDWGGRRRMLLVILDGWGIGKNDATNPIFLARTPVWDDLIQRYPHTRLQAAGEAVGLTADKAGNSEAGHMNIGAGRTVLQDDVRLDLAMKDGSFYTNETLTCAISGAKRRDKNLHLISLLSEKSSHGSIDYALALLRMAKANGLTRAYVHVIFDGRSTEPGSAPALLEQLEREIEKIGVGEIVSGIGRGLALDRDGNYAKTRYAFDA